jgi:hypothetical protein
MSGFHARALALLETVPPVSAAATDELTKLERDRGIVLPPSVREWYALEGASELLRKGIDGQGIHLDQLGRPHEGFEEPVDPVPQGRMLLMVENQGVCAWAVRLDGSSDPPVDIEYDTMPEPEWHPFTPSFSQFVRYCVWHTVRFTLPFSAEGNGGTPEALVGICDQLERGSAAPRGTPIVTVVGDGIEHYGAVGRNLLGLVGGWWQCASDSPEAFVAMVQTLRQAAGPAEQLRAGNPASKALLDSVG